MKLFINTNLNDDQVEIALSDDKSGVVFKKVFTAKHCQAEKLLLEIDKLLKKNKLVLADIDNIEVENRGDGFTSLRIGVMTANALGYALGIAVEGKVKSKNNSSIVKPIYSQNPNISKAKKKLL
jgi:tRNA A37 threonylcarbamoyladenosine modification protein TsaB